MDGVFLKLKAIQALASQLENGVTQLKPNQLNLALQPGAHQKLHHHRLQLQALVAAGVQLLLQRLLLLKSNKFQTHGVNKTISGEVVRLHPALVGVVYQRHQNLQQT